MLSPQDLASFRREGFIRVPAAFSEECALALRSEIWSEFEEEHGIRRDDRSSWRQPPRSPRRAKHHERNAELMTERFVGAISDLLGREDWTRPTNWGGFNVFFPLPAGSRWKIPTDTWHWDGSPSSEGLLVITFYSEVHPGGGGTLLLSGSPRLIESFYGSLSAEELARPHKVHRKLFSRWDPWLRALTGQNPEPIEDRTARFMQRATNVRDISTRVVELTGHPGDAVFCSLGMLHAVAPNCSEVPRFMRVKFLFLDPEHSSL